jgi:hypothetical protein
LVCSDGAQCRVDRTTIEGFGSPRASSIAANAGAMIHGEDLALLADPALLPNAAQIQCWPGASIDLRRVIATGGANAGMSFRGDDLRLFDLQLDASSAPVGVEFNACTSSIARVQAVGAAYLLLGRGGKALISDLELAFTTGSSTGTSPGGLLIDGIDLDVRRTLAHDLHNSALVVGNAPSLHIEDLDVRDIRFIEGTEESAVALVWNDEEPPPGNATADRVRIVRTERTGLATSNVNAMGPVVEVRNLEVVDAANTCTRNGNGDVRRCAAVNVAGFNRLQAERWRVSTRGPAQIKLSSTARLTAEDVEVIGTPQTNGQGAELSLEDSPRLIVRRFALAGGDVGVSFQGPAINDDVRVHLEDGRIDSSAAFATGCQFNGREVLQSVVLRDIGEVCETTIQPSADP